MLVDEVHYITMHNGMAPREPPTKHHQPLLIAQDKQMKLGKGLWKYWIGGGSTNHRDQRRIPSDTTHHHTADNDKDDTNIKDAEEELKSTLAIHELLMVASAMKTKEDEEVRQQTYEINALKERLDRQDVKLLLMNERIVKLEENNKKNNNHIHSGEDVSGIIHIGGIDDEVVSLKKEEELVGAIVTKEEVWTKVSSRFNSRNLKIEEDTVYQTMENNTYAALADDDVNVDMKEGEEMFDDEELMGDTINNIDMEGDLIGGI